MPLKIYAAVWLLGIAAVLITFLTGNFTPPVAVFFGFLSFGAIFMGMMGVLPMTVAHHGDHK
jgi:hypothetical protein